MSLIYLTTYTPTSVLAGGIIPYTTIQRRKGCYIQASNDGVILAKAGYYKVTATVVASASSAGNVVLNAMKNGVDVVGLTSTETITTPNTEYRTLVIDGIVRVYCGDGVSTLTLINSSEVDITIANATLSVEYIG